jgi:hypothetical protein
MTNNSIPHIHKLVRYGWHCCHHRWRLTHKTDDGKYIVCGITYTCTTDIIFRPTMTNTLDLICRGQLDLVFPISRSLKKEERHSGLSSLHLQRLLSVYHDAVLDTGSLIALDAYNFYLYLRGGIVGRNIASAVMCRLFYTVYFPPLVLFVRLQRRWQKCQPYLSTVHICGMLLLVIVYYVSVLICVWNTYFCWEFIFDIHQHHSIYD